MFIKLCFNLFCDGYWYLVKLIIPTDPELVEKIIEKEEEQNYAWLN